MFCLEYLKDFNATQAAKRSGYSPKTAGTIGSEHMQKPAIKAYLSVLTKKLSKNVELSVENVIESIMEIRKKCMDPVPILNKDGEDTGIRNFKEAGALRANELLAKYLGMFEQKVSIKGSIEIDDKKKSKTDIITRISELELPVKKAKKRSKK